MGWIGIIIGIVSLVLAFTGGGWGAAALGVLSIIFGVLILTNVIFMTAAFPFILGGIAFLAGIISLVGGLVKS
jgi:uncharacterized membrane protein HdeD (DUF308 family)